MTLRHLWQRLTGREAAALRHQRDAADEQAGIERQRRMEIQRNRDFMLHDTVPALLRAERERDAAVQLLRDLVAAQTRGPIAIENAIADAAVWLRAKKPVDDETLPSAGEKDR